MLIRFRLALAAGLLIGLALLIGLGKATAPVQAQGTEEDPVTYALKQAAQYLSKQIGKPIPRVDNYTYELVTFPDAGLGCPEQGKTYSPAPTQGYKFLITFGGVSYDVHTTLDGLRVAYCSGTAIRQEPGLAVYRSPLFSIAYPDEWSFIPRSADIFFGLSATPVCSQPGMTVAALGTVASGQTPDALLDDYARTTPGVQLGKDRIAVGNTGRSTLYVAPCTDGSPRMTRVTAFVAYGRGYRVLQFAPQSAFSQWADTYLKILQRFSPGTAGGSGSSGQAVRQPDQSPRALLAHVFAGNIYVGILAGLPGKPITTDAAGDHAYRDVVVAPDGTRVAFIDPDHAVLLVASVAGDTPPLKLADHLATGYPAAWSPDGSQVAYLVDEGAKDGDRAVYSLMTARADGQGTRKIGDTQGLKTGCTARATDPAESIYRAETGPGGNGLLLVWSQGLIYYSLGCDGLGVGRIGEDGANRATVHPTLRRAHLSPDGSELLGIADGDAQTPGLVRVQLRDQRTSSLATTGLPDQVAWSADGKAIYYSTLAAKNTITLNDESLRERGTKLFGVWPYQATVYEVTLRRIDLAANQDVPLAKADGRAIGRIAPGPDGSGVLFTLVQSTANLVEAFENNVSTGDLRRQMPNSLLYWLSLPNGRPLADGQPQLLAMTDGPVWGPLGSASAPTPTSGPRQTPGAPAPTATTARPTQVVSPPPTNTRQPPPTGAAS
jgi:hypothetical protein